MLQRLAQYIVRVQQQAREWVGKKARPYLLCVLNPQSAAYTVTGVTCGKEGEVGYQIRYDSHTVGKDCKIKFMTDCILLKEVAVARASEV